MTAAHNTNTDINFNNCKNIRCIKYVSWGGYSGYAIAAKRYIRSLINAGIKVYWVPMLPSTKDGLWYAPSEKPEPHDHEFAHLCSPNSDYDAVIVHIVPEYFPMWIQKEKNTGKKIIGYTVWETEVLPKHWVPLLNSIDSIIVPCKWNKEVFIKAGVKVPIAVIPHIALAASSKNITELWNIPKNDFVFYNINTWTARKAIWLTIEAYLRAFTSKDPVTLIIKTSIDDTTKPNSFLKKLFGASTFASARSSFNKILARFSDPARIIFVDQTLSDMQVLQIHERGNCYVSLCRSEGWGLGAFDACAYGNPVIISGYCEKLEFLQSDKTYLVDYKLIKLQDASDPNSYSQPPYWSDPDIQHAIKIMQQVVNNPIEARNRGKASQTIVCEQFSDAKIGSQFVEFLNQRINS